MFLVMSTYQIPRRQEVESFLKTNLVMFTYQIPRRFTYVSHRGNPFIAFILGERKNSWFLVQSVILCA